MSKIVWLIACGLLLLSTGSMGVDATGPDSSGHPEDSVNEQSAEDASTHMQRATALLHEGDYEAAIAEYRQALKLDPKLQEARIFLRSGVRSDTVGFRAARDLTSLPSAGV